jgi:hypothetical protein
MWLAESLQRVGLADKFKIILVVRLGRKSHLNLTAFGKPER